MKNRMLIGIVGAVALASGVVLVAREQKTTLPSSIPQSTTPTVSQTVSEDEKNRIDAWIAKNNLNPYGDPKDTAYAGGTPLFNEATGQTIDRYEYIIQNHPDRLWNK